MKILSPSMLASAVLIASLTGCQSLFDPAVQTTDSQESVVVQIRPASGKPKNIQVPLTPNMRLQDVLDASKPGFRRQKAYIVRTSPNTGGKHKLEATFGSNRRISLETDYAIQPGDRVVIAQDTTTSFDKVMQSVMGRS